MLYRTGYGPVTDETIEREHRSRTAVASLPATRRRSPSGRLRVVRIDRRVRSARLVLVRDLGVGPRSRPDRCRRPRTAPRRRRGAASRRPRGSRRRPRSTSPDRDRRQPTTRTRASDRPRGRAVRALADGRRFERPRLVGAGGHGGRRRAYRRRFRRESSSANGDMRRRYRGREKCVVPTTVGFRGTARADSASALTRSRPWRRRSRTPPRPWDGRTRARGGSGWR